MAATASDEAFAFLLIKQELLGHLGNSSLEAYKNEPTIENISSTKKRKRKATWGSSQKNMGQDVFVVG